MTRLVGRPLNWAITATAGSGFLLFGYDQGVMSGLLTGDAFTRNFPTIDITRGGSSTIQGTVVAIYEIGCFFGALFCMVFGEHLGRRKCIALGCIVLSIGAALQASSYSLAQLIVGRVVAGLGNGMNTSTIPVWHSELMSAHNRGKGLCIELAINIFGVALSYWVDYGMSFVKNESQFRFPLAFQIFFALLTLGGIVMHIIWAVHSGAKLLDIDSPKVSHDLHEIQRAIIEEREAASAGTYRALLTNGQQRFFYRTMLGIGGQFMQQLSGINLITYYAPVIFQTSVGMSHNTSLLLAGFNGIAYWISSLIPIWIIDRLGRRKLMLFAAAGQCACMAILAGTVHDGGKAAGIVAIIMLFLFNFFFAVGLLAIPWLLPAEYAPLAIRTRAASLATASNWIFTFLVVEITPVSINSIGYKTYVYFCIFNFCFLPLIYFFYPETRNLSLEDIDTLFTGENIIFHAKPGVGMGNAPEKSTGEAVFDKDKNVVQLEKV
ncbi:MFS sugar transporter, putative [Talaromyces stipitatus ATCC 10500]|uniref:MFS sugar transporter, putative n=1 Tax=Talaromyces stipitatus (strain ATCC 10500 / CBS 375.48 / QM 6759 / NRRL 1006) TaxID=441959 RepID=B8M9A9_TALSN|nr:MFS sugar transporter, putative [Talaromyces stipitatus ATCC 10500]EED17669.1 MFS sugar transporter, putative [Talaromyces stipitatus ATCC 10500]